MNWLIYILFVLVLGVFLFAQTPFNRTSVSVFLIAVLIFSMPFYFASKRSGQPTTTEAVIATVWLWFRRLVCWVGALGFAATSVWLVVKADMSNGFFETVGAPLFCAFMAMFLFYVGLVGQGNNRAQWKDDIRLHKENKQRYKWKW